MVGFMFVLVDVSSANLYVDGSGPLPPEFVVQENFANSFQFNTPSPGILYQNTLNHPGEIGWGGAFFRLTESAATAELNHAQGWFFETKVNAIH